MPNNMKEKLEEARKRREQAEKEISELEKEETQSAQESQSNQSMTSELPLTMQAIKVVAGKLADLEKRVVELEKANVERGKMIDAVKKDPKGFLDGLFGKK